MEQKVLVNHKAMTFLSGQAHSAAESKDKDFENTFQQHWERVYRFLFRLTGDHAEAEDLALETFLRLWQRPPANPDGLGGWLFRVAANLGYNALRASHRRSGYETRAGQEPLFSTETPDPASELEALDARQLTRHVLEKMSQRQAQLLLLRHSGLSYQEIAAALGIAPGSVGTLLVRAEQEFEKLYQLETGDNHAPER
jgi:RNA polymerase sigma-70 factor (ECF subfamily)